MKYFYTIAFCFIFGFLFYCLSAYAAEEISISQESQNATGALHPTQTFTALNWNITGFSFFADEATTTIDWAIYVCGGEIDGSITANENGRCEGEGQTVIYYGLMTDVNILDDDWTYFNIDTKTTNVNDTYWIHVESVPYGASDFNFRSDNTNPYTYGYALGGSGASSPPWYTAIDWKFRIYYDPAYNADYTNYDYSLDATTPDFATVNNLTCILDEPCNLWFSFNDLAVGYPMYLVYYASSTVPDNAIASTTITATPLWQNKIVVPDPEEEGAIKYNLLLDAFTFGWVVKTGINISWMSSSTWQSVLDDKFSELTEEYCAEETICADVASSSDFFYGINCGFRRVICWTFAPSANSKKYILSSVESFENSFPFNTVFEFINRTSNAIKTAEQSDDTIDFPFIDGEGNFIMLPVVSSSTVPDALGTSIDEVNTGLDYFIWLAMGALFLFLIFKFIL